MSRCRSSNAADPQDVTEPGCAASSHDSLGNDLTTVDQSDAATQTEKWRDDLRTYRNHLWTLRQTAQVQADNLILALSGILLTLSVSFVTDLVPLSRAICVWALVSSWVFLALAMAAVLISHLLGRAAIDEQLRDTEAEIAGRPRDTEAAFTNPDSDGDRKRATLSRWTNVLNWLSAVLLGIGVGLTMLFVIQNVLMEVTTMPKPMKKSMPVKEGVTPPPAPRPPMGVPPPPAPKKPVSAPPPAPPAPAAPKE